MGSAEQVGSLYLQCDSQPIYNVNARSINGSL